jgi:FkbM family methyltransferase
MPLLETFRLITGHPLNRRHPARALLRYAAWQARCRLRPGDHEVPWVNATRLRVRAGETGLTGNVYCGLHEFVDMAFVLHAIGEGTLFVDVGANAGAYTVLAAGARGASAVSVEPIPDTFARLTGNIGLNGLAGRVEALNIGLSDQPGTLRFTSRLDCVNHVATSADSPEACLEVPVSTLDSILAGRVPLVVKIDVEGYEAPVLRGASRTLAHPDLQAVILETNHSGTRYGLAETAVTDPLLALGFHRMTYEPFSRTLVPLTPGTPVPANTLFVRDPKSMQARLKHAPPFRVLGREV